MTGSGVVPTAGSNRPDGFSLVNVYPNPFNATTTVVLDLARPSEVMVDVVNVSGQVVGRIHHGQLAVGQHNFSWTADALASGVYWLRATVPGGWTATRRITLVK
ncbi:T9SS type A sorting domain-containing protein [bacterium]|nr:T9SS type A sorting domain-containing protein [bacterium]